MTSYLCTLLGWGWACYVHHFMQTYLVESVTCNKLHKMWSRVLFLLGFNLPDTVNVISGLSNFNWWRKTLGALLCTISGMSGHPSRTSKVLKANWIASSHERIQSLWQDSNPQLWRASDSKSLALNDLATHVPWSHENHIKGIYAELAYSDHKQGNHLIFPWTFVQIFCHFLTRLMKK